MQSKRMYSQLLKDELVIMILGNLVMCLVTLKTSCLFMFFFSTMLFIFVVSKGCNRCCSPEILNCWSY